MKNKVPCTYRDVIVKNKTLLLTDSNGRCIDAKRFVPKEGVQRHTCYTLADVETFTKEAKIDSQPTKVLLQVGTNTLTQVDSGKVLKSMTETIDKVRERFPEARIYVSSFLPRNDNLHDMAMDVNKLLAEVIDDLKRVSYIDNINISKANLFDRLHLDTQGFYKFLWNLRFGMFGLLPQTNMRHSNNRRYHR